MKSISKRKNQIKKVIKELPVSKIEAAELFSHFTASILNKKVLFIR
jgi:hypothetical protein